MKTLAPLSLSQPSATKAKVLHIVWDRKVGGVKSTLTGLIQSQLQQTFDFRVLALREDQPIQHSGQLSPDIIICHQPARFKTAVDLIRLKLKNPRAPIIIHEHGYSAAYEHYNVSSRLRFHTSLKVCYGLADQVVAISQAQAQWMLQHQLVHPEKVAVIRQCPPLHAYLTVPPKSPQRPLILAAYGRFCQQKGFDSLIKAVQTIPEAPVEVWMGGVGDQEAALKHLARDLPQVKWMGRIDDVPHFLKSVDVVVIPSRWEPWGNVCLEAKAAARPVIVSDVDGLTEQVQQCGLCVPADDPDALAQAIQTVLQQPADTLMQWGQYGREAVHTCWETYIAEWGALLQSLLPTQRSLKESHYD